MHWNGTCHNKHAHRLKRAPPVSSKHRFWRKNTFQQSAMPWFNWHREGRIRDEWKKFPDNWNSHHLWGNIGNLTDYGFFQTTPVAVLLSCCLGSLAWSGWNGDTVPCPQEETWTRSMQGLGSGWRFRSSLRNRSEGTLPPLSLCSSPSWQFCYAGSDGAGSPLHMPVNTQWPFTLPCSHLAHQKGN